MSLKAAFKSLVGTLREVKSVKELRVLDEGALLVTLSPLGFDENIIVYLIAGGLSPEFIKKVVNANTHADIHTLFILSRDLLPADGSICQPDRSLRLLSDLYAGRFYAYCVTAREVQVFPVSISQNWKVAYGQPVNIADLRGEYVVLNTRYIRGVRKVAAFEAREFHRPPAVRRVYDPLQPFYDLLGVPVSASAAEVKRAYRRKARQHHPDADKSPDATAKMQRINEAYEQIMKRFE